jgi:nicotinate-nucleotide adenylyltransferase
VRLGLFGGTFDPPHLGHVIAAQDALAALNLDRVVFIPAGVPPHKQDRTVSAAPLRTALVAAAIEGDERFSLDERELRRHGPSYTVDTLREYRTEFPEAELFLLIGVDQFEELSTWREPSEIAALARIAVLDRAGTATAQPEAGEPLRVPVTRIDVSSTEIRRRVGTGQPIRYLVPAAVEALIRTHNLYPGAGFAARESGGVQLGNRNAPGSQG